MKLHHTFVAFGLLLLIALSIPAGAFPSVTKLSDTVVDTQAMTLSGGTYGYAINGLSFQQNPLVTHNGWQYAAYYNGSRRVCVARRQLPSGAWSSVALTDYLLSTTNDAHNVVCMGICPNDGTIHLSFDHHGGVLHYRVSQADVATNPGSVTWNASLFGPVRDYLISGQTVSSVTYPAFWHTPDGDLQFGYRAGGSGAGDWYMVDYTAATGLWSNNRQVINRSGTFVDELGSSPDRNAYLNTPMGYGPDRNLYFTWTWRESATGSANHDVMYTWSNDRGTTWYNNALPAGFRIGTAGSVPQTMFSLKWINDGLQVVGLATGDPLTEELITLFSPGITVVPVGRIFGMMNQQAQAIDAQSRVHTIMWHCTPETYNGYSWSQWGPIGARRYYHYWRDAQAQWHRNQLPFDTGNISTWVGSRPKLFIRSNGDAYAVYQSWRSASLTGTGIYILNGDLVIAAATEASQWTDWQTLHVESGPFLGEALADPYYFEDGVLSVVMQNSPGTTGASTSLRVLNYQLD